MLITTLQESMLKNKNTNLSFEKHIRRGGKPQTFLPFQIGQGYSEFWKTKKRYRVVKGSRASKKTVTTAKNFIWNLMKYPDSNLVVIRKVMRTNKDSTFAELKKAIKDLGVQQFWKWTTSPLEITYIPTGQKILFRGMDDPLKITGISVDTGHLCWAWIEEAYELQEESDFQFIDESLRGNLPQELWYQFTLTLNPWNNKHWIKSRFFDPIFGVDETKEEEHQDIHAQTTNYYINEFIDESFKKTMKQLRERNPKRYRVAGKGEWGTAEGVIFENWSEEVFDWKEKLRKKGNKVIFGLDFGYTQDPAAFIGCVVDQESMKIYIFDEVYQTKLSNRAIADELQKRGYAKEVIIADHAEPKSIDDLKRYGIRRVKGAKKGKDSIKNGIQDIQDYKLIVHSKNCQNTIFELENYLWDPKKINVPIDKHNHLMDALRYAMEDIRFKNTGKAMRNPLI